MKALLALLLLLAGPGFAAPAKAKPAKPTVAATTTGDRGVSASAETPRSSAADDRVPLDLKLPKPAFIGTPRNVPAGTTVEKVSGKLRPPFRVPPGTVNLAAGLPAGAGGSEPLVGEAKLITDGDKEATDGSYVEFGRGLKSVTIDLGANGELAAILVWHYHGDPRVYHDVVVQVADDPDFITNVRTLYNNDADNTAGLGVGRDREYFETYEGRLIDAKLVKARYVKLWSNGSTADEMNRYTEVEVYGRPVK